MKVGRRTLITQDAAEAWLAALPEMSGTIGADRASTNNPRNRVAQIRQSVRDQSSNSVNLPSAVGDGNFSTPEEIKMSWKSINRKTSKSVERGGKAKEHTATKNGRSKFRPASAAKFPIVLAEWPRNHNQVVRIVLTDYNGRKGINIRVWFRAEGGDVSPHSHRNLAAARTAF